MRAILFFSFRQINEDCMQWQTGNEMAFDFGDGIRANIN